MTCMTDRMTMVQARLSEDDAQRLDADMQTLGLRSRSEALRTGLRLLHRHARHAGLAKEYDEFYGAGETAPVTDLAAMGDTLWAELRYSDDLRA